MSRLGRGTRNQQGFTIVEMMITLLILGILVGIVVMTMLVSKTRAQQAACKANLRIIDGAIQQYSSIHEGVYPPDLNTLMDQSYIKGDFKWMCPSGNYDLTSGDYRDYYDPAAGQTSCPRPTHNP